MLSEQTDSEPLSTQPCQHPLEPSLLEEAVPSAPCFFPQLPHPHRLEGRAGLLRSVLADLHIFNLRG